MHTSWPVWEDLWQQREEVRRLWRAGAEARHLLQEATRSLERLWSGWPADLQGVDALRRVLPQIGEALLARAHKHGADLLAVPTAVFSQPAVAVVGLPEHDARATYARVRTHRSEFVPLKHRLSGRNRKNLVKLVVDDERDRVLGCHVVAADAAEIIQGFAVALKLGVTKAQLDAVVGVHPTSAEELVTLR